MIQMDFKTAKIMMRKFAKEYVEEKGVTVQLTELVYWMMEDMTRKQEKVLASIFNREWNKVYEKQYKLTDITAFTLAASEFNI